MAGAEHSMAISSVRPGTHLRGSRGADAKVVETRRRITIAGDWDGKHQVKPSAKESCWLACTRRQDQPADTSIVLVTANHPR